MIIYGYRYIATGMFDHVYCRDGSQLCRVSGPVLPSSPVRISGLGRNWFSAFDMESTLFPGLTRTATDPDTGEEVLRLVYRDVGRFELAMDERVLRARSSGDSHRFYDGDTEVASIGRTDGPLPPPPGRIAGDAAPLCVVHMRKGLTPSWQLAILAYPMLRFAP